ncbi:4'-phosphopantetheinyl transferase superfamily protein [Niveibacterium sp. COAC-50]|uniref:4'-phosphopantetheinyl transferase family protein n=1 Tax=Niveibacterium sp. COAC-50 TaxID=2729384 RepID=UPI00155310F0|nr:4'-phosphopantetheinyl transferase superfamily protein [Niveibacterium sp. COAC-50]
MARWPVFEWPAQAPPPSAPCVVLALALAPDMPRADARARVREAAREYIAARLRVAPESLTLRASPGLPPQLVGYALGLSFSHEPGCSLVAVNWDGPVGVDLMRVALPEDWAAVARDYLGPAIAEHIAATPLELRAEAFSQAWTQLEASLKLRGEALREWRAGDVVDACRCSPLTLPAGYIGTLALPR